ncbi:S24 family peptidase [Staphylococcus aureus]|nr:helix-turn-helix domain-containing protein [Staphylococcus aureus]WRN26214.1 S24 family peptidase [Staphylococcus aureus]WRN32523.1 S24 family peptidase [Staphylococcus aureus]
MREKVSNRLKHIMKIRNLKQVDIINKSKPYQKKLGISLSKSTLSQYINDVQSPDQDRIYLLSKTLNVGEAWLMGYDVDSYRVPDEERQDETIMSKINNIFSQLTPPRQENVLNYANEQLDEQNSKGDNVVDINSYKQEKTPVNVNGCVSAGVGERLHDETLFTEMVKGPIPTHDLALKVNGDSMEPMFKDGEIIFVEKTHNIKNGQIGIFIIEEEAYVKKVFVEDDRLTLVSLNKEYDDLHFYRNESVRLIGKVIL